MCVQVGGGRGFELSDTRAKRTAVGASSDPAERSEERIADSDGSASTQLPGAPGGFRLAERVAAMLYSYQVRRSVMSVLNTCSHLVLMRHKRPSCHVFPVMSKFTCLVLLGRWKGLPGCASCTHCGGAAY